MFDNTTSPRRLTLVDQFDRAAHTKEGLRGALVTIEQSPFKIADYFRQHANEWPERAGRAEAVLGKLADTTRDEWARIANCSAGVATTFRRLGRETSTRLLRHGYVTAMANLHVILAYPFLEVPPIQRFETLVT
jgi:hypothetical protein